MINSVRMIPSGFEFIDKNWGGVYRGGSYLLVGPRKSGRTLLGLQFALEAARASEVCLYFTLMRPKDLMIQAASLNFDIQSYMNQNLIIVIRVAPPNEVYGMYNPDDYLVEYFKDILTVVNQYNPTRIIFDELTPFVGFKNLDYLRNTFLNTVETIEERDITSLFIISEPATPKAHAIVEGLSQFVTGIIRLSKPNDRISRFQGGRVTITPNVGHTEGEFTAEYKIRPNKGVSTEFLEDTFSTEEYESIYPTKENHFQGFTTKQTRFDIPPEPYAFSNIYNYNDFLLILNNQIALYKSTGQIFYIISFKLDPVAQVKGLLSVNQLQNSIRISTSKKDKICVIENKVIVLLVKGSLKGVVDLISNVQNNLPSKDPAYLKAVMEYISIFNTAIDERFDNAESLMEYVLSAETSATNAYQPLNKFLG
ncbi:RAD55 family ATPase [Melioribacter sp. OK-6-Me]|uniref:RAD55 family ATPase n=1 Tax=unclassified Melioribacter TaxID=2627329 RepID=UPI003EDB3197